MKFTYVSRYLLIGFLYSLYSVACANDIRKYFDEALLFTETARFQSIVEAVENSKKVKAFIQRDFDAAGNMLLRQEIFLGEKIFLTIIVNDKNIYQITPDGKIVENKIDDPVYNPTLNWFFPKELRLLAQTLNCQYEDAGRTSHNGVPCRRIKFTIPSDDQSRNTLETLIPKPYLSEKPKLYPYTIVFLIGQSKPFIYKFSMYDELGELTGEEDFGKVNLAPRFQKSTFQLPAGCKPVVVKTPKAIRKVYAVVKPSLFAKLENYFSQKWIQFSSFFWKN